MLDALREEFSDHADGMEADGEHSGQGPEADHGNEDNAHDQLRYRSQQIQHRSRYPVGDPVRRGVMGGEQGERQRKRNGERGSGDRHRQCIGQRPQPSVEAPEIRWKHIDRQLLHRRPRIRKTLRIEQTG